MDVQTLDTTGRRLKILTADSEASLRDAVLDRFHTQLHNYTPPYLTDQMLASKSALEGERKQVTGAFAELERNLMRERTMAGLASARRRGRKGGRRPTIDSKTFAMALQLYEAQTESVQSICEQLGMAKRTFYRYLAAYGAQRQQ